MVKKNRMFLYSLEIELRYVLNEDQRNPSHNCCSSNRVKHSSFKAFLLQPSNTALIIQP